MLIITRWDWVEFAWMRAFPLNASGKAVTIRFATP